MNTIRNQNLSAGNQLKPSRILVMGPQANAIANALVRMKGNTEIHHAESAAEAIAILADGNFEHVLVDNRNDGALTLTIPRLAQLKSIGRITVLAGPNSAPSISAIPGIGQVITPPYNPVEIAGSLGIEVVDSRKQSRSEVSQERRSAASEIENPVVTETATVVVTEVAVEAPLIIRIIGAMANFIPSLTPILSALYKNLALSILAALFLAFVTYGIMIAYFLTSGDWSSPLQLQPGHELVVKADRERSELKVKRNLASQQLAEARNKGSEAEDALNRADTLASITAGIIDQEIANKSGRFEELKSETALLESVLAGFGNSKTRTADRNSLERDFKNRVISRAIYQSSMLNIAQVERQVADLRSEITAKKNELAMSEQANLYLVSMKQQLENDAAVTSGTGQTAYIPLTNQIIEVRQIRSAAKADIAASRQAVPSLENTLAVLSAGIEALEKTPMIKALNKPVNVLFVPYDNLDVYGENQPLFACSLALFWCSNVGQTGQAIGGEISTTHPFFGKPLRGQFVEALLTDPTAAKKDILHVGRPPFFF